MVDMVRGDTAGAGAPAAVLEVAVRPHFALQPEDELPLQTRCRFSEPSYSEQP